MLKRELHKSVRVYISQNATLLEITCHGSFTFKRVNNKGADQTAQRTECSAPLLANNTTRFFSPGGPDHITRQPDAMKVIYRLKTEMQ